MGLYDILSPDDNSSIVPEKDTPKKKKRFYGVDEGPTPELPSPREPVAVSAVIPAGNTYHVIPMKMGDVQPPPAGDTGNHPAVASTPAPAQPAGYDDPIIENLRQSLMTLKNTSDAPVVKENRLKAFLHMAAAGLDRQPAGNTWQDVARQAGSAIGGGLSGVIEPRLPGAIKKMYNVQQQEQDVDRAEKAASTSSMIQRRADMTDLSTKRLGVAQRKAELDVKYKDWLQKHGDQTAATGKRNADTAENRQRFLQESGWTKILNQEEQNDWRHTDADRKFNENRRQFDANQHIKEQGLKLTERRTTAYEESVRNGANKTQANLAADRAEADALDDQAAEFEGIITTLDPDVDSSEIAKLKGAAITNRRMAVRKRARAGGDSSGWLDPAPAGAPDPNKGVTANKIAGMSEAEFRSHYADTIPRPTPQQIESAVKLWKKRYNK